MFNNLIKWINQCFNSVNIVAECSCTEEELTKRFLLIQNLSIMENSSLASTTICGYWRDTVPTKLIIDALVFIIIKYAFIEEYFIKYGDELKCIENKLTVVYDWDILDMRLKHLQSGGYNPYRAVHWPQSVYGKVQLQPSTLKANWKLQFALPQSHTQICFIGITSCTSLADTNPGRLARNFLSKKPNWQRDDMYFGFEIAPRQTTNYEQIQSS